MTLCCYYFAFHNIPQLKAFELAKKYPEYKVHLRIQCHVLLVSI
jgi:hypothetical protein